jgi:hypothetical protein
MRKVLLATTALVALGGVSAASADVTMSGSGSFNYVVGDGTGFVTDSRTTSTNSDANITMTNALDNGMTATTLVSLDEGGVDDAGLKLTGDFGTLAFGGVAGDAHGAMSADVTADEGMGMTATYSTYKPGDEQIPHSTISLALPAVSGVSISLGIGDGATDTTDSTQAGISYAMDAGAMGITVAYAASSDGTAGGANDATNTGIKVTAGAATVTMISGTIGDYENTAIGATYKVSDALTVQAYTGSTELDTNANYEVNDTGIGLTYTITTGMSLSVTHNDYDGKNGTAADAESGSRTAIALDITY